jgi:hypothetical protein
MVKRVRDVMPQFFPSMQNAVGVFKRTATGARESHPMLCVLLKFDGDSTYQTFCPLLYPGGKKVLAKIFQNKMLPFVCANYIFYVLFNPTVFFSCFG